MSLGGSVIDLRGLTTVGNFSDYLLDGNLTDTDVSFKNICFSILLGIATFPSSH